MTVVTRKNFVRSIWFVIATAIIVYMLPRTDTRKYTYEINRPWGYSLLTAPFDIPIHPDSLSAAKTLDSINAAFIPVFKRDADAEKRLTDAFNSRIASNPQSQADLTPHQRQTVNNGLRQLLDDGIVDQSVYNEISSGRLPRVRYITTNVARSTSTSRYRSPRLAYTFLDSILSAAHCSGVLRQINFARIIEPNIVTDSLTSRRLLTDLYQRATAPIGVVQQGERIVDRGDLVTPQLYNILNSYERMIAERGTKNTTDNIYPLTGQILYVVLLLGALMAYLYFFRPRLFSDNNVVLFLVTLITAFVAAAFFMADSFTSGLYLMPFTMVPIMVKVFFDGRTALFSHLIVILICAVVSAFTLEFIFIQFLAGVTAINSLKELSRRSQLLRTALMVFIAYALGYVAIELMQTGSFNNLTIRMFGCFAINAVFISFAYVLIFVFEKLFGFTSMVTLVELSDINNPLMRELSERCPGTFQHAMSVSNLASVAATRLGANVQLVRAGALYHDIGKIDNPAFFTENQHGVNPHDSLAPEQSARIIIGHVTDGLRRADKAKLPAVIRSFISEHHGRGTARYFYNSACAANPDTKIDPEPYRYPGPNPQSVETSILMMADAVEAASRSLKNYSVEAITELVNRIIDTQISEGLHNDSPISFHDVREVKAAFIERLRTIYHTRIAYPSDPKPQA